MKKGYFIVLLFLLLGIDKSVHANEQDELIEMASIVAQHELAVEEWQVVIREKMPNKTLKRYLKGMDRDSKVTKETKDGITTYIFEEPTEKNALSVMYKIILPGANRTQGEFIAIISADKTTENVITSYKNTKKFLFNSYFSQNAHKFTCIQAINGVIIGEANLLNKLINSFEIKNINKQNDTFRQNVFVEEVYGYTNKWEEKLMIMDQPMNIHLAFIQKANGKEKIIIGTPIIIHEY